MVYNLNPVITNLGEMKLSVHDMSHKMMEVRKKHSTDSPIYKNAVKAQEFLQDANSKLEKAMWHVTEIDILQQPDS